MRLIKIKLAGFKSFVEPTVIPLTHNLVGIVGPNGCGKSNIIDAVRWVLGESRASALRGESLQDVIFGGSEKRKAVGRASVELVFDNSLANVTGAWSSYAEIAIKRIIHRDGNSIYYINNIHVRRRDIADLFLGTGVSGRGYAIIEQGMISRIIEAKPQDLKTFLEEAAGISKYRERRHETELRLADTRRNLIRIEDIAAELLKQIDHLQNQARSAAKYNALTQQLHETQQVLWLQQKNEASTQRLATEEKIRSLEQELETEITTSQLNKTQREQIRAREHSLSEKLHELQGQLYSTSAEKTRLDQEITQLHKNKERLSHQIQDLEKQEIGIQQQLSTTTDNLQHWRVEKDNAQTSYQSGTQENKLENAKLPELDTIFNHCQKAFENAQKNLVLTEQENHLAKTHIKHTDKTIQQLESRKNRLQKEYDALIKIDHETLLEIQSKLEQTENKLISIRKTLSQAESTFSRENIRKDKTASLVHEFEKKLSLAQAQFDALENLQQKIDNNDALKNWLQRYQLDASPRLWQHIQIEKDWENALESILQERLNSIGFSQLDAINDWSNDLPPGKLSLFEFPKTDGKAKARQQQALTYRTEWLALSSFLVYNQKDLAPILNEWLKNIYVVENISTGLQLRHQLASDEILVTREGHTITCHNINFHSPDAHLHGILSRQHKLNQIQKEISALKKELEGHQNDLGIISVNHEKLQQTIQNCRKDQQQLTQQQHHLQLEKTKLSQIKAQTQQRSSLITAELDEINQQLVSENQQKKRAEQQSSSHFKQIEETKKLVLTTKNELAIARQQLADQHQLIQHSNKKIQEAAFNEKICQNKINDIENLIKVLEKDIVQLNARRDSLLTEKDNLDDTAFKSQLNDCIFRHKQLEQQIAITREQLKTAKDESQKNENELMASEHKQTRLRESISELYLTRQSSSLQEERYTEQLNEAQADETVLTSLVGQKSIAVLQTEINNINKKITAMGSVNLAALDELKTSQQRETSLNAQIQDLKEATAILENAIEQIDQETKKRLLKTFNAVNQNLSEIFPIIFSGGKAALVFSDGKILDSGITLTAQPPGKKNNSIHLLSGGEKALTALALIFSIFRLNPAPFCLLDEVDAPLDDSNTGRFCELVKNLSQQTQFLFISHNKITMEIAQQLIGITMQDQGVSKVVAVDIADTIITNNNKETVLSES